MMINIVLYRILYIKIGNDNNSILYLFTCWVQQSSRNTNADCFEDRRATFSAITILIIMKITTESYFISDGPFRPHKYEYVPKQWMCLRVFRFQDRSTNHVEQLFLFADWVRPNATVKRMIHTREVAGTYPEPAIVTKPLFCRIWGYQGGGSYEGYFLLGYNDV
jgi:hypothetical protein